ncbi:MAG: NHLP bacteriocin system secretion protein [Anaerolineae bacterium]|nr:NHLP bacteriocin system secretion protein [Gloeobacterales cyanobacterium ES-bin-313]
MAKTKGLFREKSIQRLSSPEKLDQMMQVTYSTDWLILLCLGLLIAVAIAWSILGRIPTTVAGRGVLIFPRTVTQFQAPASGRVVRLLVQEGALVKKGQVIGVIDQPELQARLQQLNARYADVQTRAHTANNLTQANQVLAKRSIQTQRQDLQRSITTNQSLLPALKQQFENVKQLREKGLVAEGIFIQSQQDYFTKLREINTQKTQFSDLDAREQDVDRQGYSAATVWADQRSQIELDIRLTQKRIKDTSRILSPEDGRILSISINRGNFVEEGRILGTVQKQDASGRLVGLLYFIDGDGKRIKSGMAAQLTPDTVEQQRFGSIIGTVAKATEFPITPSEVAAIVGKDELANLLTSGGRHIQILTKLTLDPKTFSSYKWTTSQGPPVKISNGTTCSVLVTVEERPPITYVIPILRSFTGIR